jgi:hypothetical protein
MIQWWYHLEGVFKSRMTFYWNAHLYHGVIQRFRVLGFDNAPDLT